VAGVAAHLLGPAGVDGDAVQRQRRDSVAEEVGLALVGLHQREGDARQGQLQRQPGEPATAADVGDALVAAETVGVEDDERTEDQPLPGLAGVANGGQVGGAVALQEQVEEAAQARLQLGAVGAGAQAMGLGP
jgi:hypothetical protein